MKTSALVIAASGFCCLLVALTVGCSQRTGVVPSATVPVQPEVLQSGGSIPQWEALPEPKQTIQPMQLATGPDGNVWVTEWTGGAIERITLGTNRIQRFPVPRPNLYLDGITTGPDQNIWFCSPNGEIGKVTPDGQVTMFTLGANYAPFSIAMGVDGNLWLTDAGASRGIDRFTVNGVLTQYSIPGFAAPFDIVSGSDGNLWFDEGSAGFIYRITTAGVVTTFALPTSDAFVVGMTAAVDGNIWFAEYDRCNNKRCVPGRKLGRVTPAGVITEYYIPGHHPQLPISARKSPEIFFTEDEGLARFNIQTHHYEVLGAPPNGDYIGFKTIPADGNVWFSQSREIGVYVRYVLSVSPSSLTLNPGQQQTLTATESGNKQSLNATSSNGFVASVSPSGSNTFLVTGVAAGMCVITIFDNRRNTFRVPVTVE